MANLTVEREKYTAKDKKEYYGYFVRGKLRGREVQVDLLRCRWSGNLQWP